MKQLSGEGEPLLLCSAGDFYGGGNAYNEPKDHFVARMMSYLKYDAVAVGENDLSYGLDKLVRDWKIFKMNLICANLFKEGGGEGSRKPLGRRVFPAFRIVSKGGLKVGFIALLSPKLLSLNKGSTGADKEKKADYLIEDALQCALKILPGMRKKCDVIVLLAHMDKIELEKLLPDLPGIDIAVLGHSLGAVRTKEPFLMGTVPVYMSSYQGQALGSLKITLGPDREIADTHNNIYILGREIKDDEKVAATVMEFEETSRKQQKELYAKQMLSGSNKTASGQDVYLGLGNCLRCHAKEFEIYTHTKHARAYATLSSSFKHRDSNCIKCHSTGYGKSGGFNGVRIAGGLVDLVDVQCEACHGPGAEHKRDGTYASRAIKSCSTCHTKEHDPEFDFSAGWKKIEH